MMKQWQFDVLFFVGVGGAVVMLFGPTFGLEVEANPIAATGVGIILTYVLNQRHTLTKNDAKKEAEHARRDD